MLAAFVPTVILALVGGTLSKLTNRTIDDTFAGQGPIIQYYPATYWEHPTGTSACSTCPPATEAYNSSYSDAIYIPTVPGEDVIPWMSIIFNGTAIYAYTILLNGEPYLINITLDGKPSGQFVGTTTQNFQYNASMFAIDNLSNGLHIVQFSAGGTETNAITFDYADYTISDTPISYNAPSNHVNYIISGTSGEGAIVQYLPVTGWQQNPVCSACPDAHSAFNGTYQMASFSPDAYPPSPPMLSIIFNGSAIQLFTVSVKNQTSQVNITLDGQLVDTFIGKDPSDGDYEYNVSMYTNAGLPYGLHVLQLEASGSIQNSLIFEYAIYGTNGTAPPVSSTGSVSVSYGSSTLAAPSSTNTGSAASVESPSRKSFVGAIVGGVIAGIVVVVAAAFAWRSWQYRHRGRLDTIINLPPEVKDVIITEPLGLHYSEDMGYRHAGPTQVTTGNAISPPRGAMGAHAQTDSFVGRQLGMVSQSRQAFLTRRMQEKLAAMSDLQRRATIPPPDAGSVLVSQESDVAAVPELQAQVDALRGEVEELQAQLRSAWAMGLSDEAPPEYEENE